MIADVSAQDLPEFNLEEEIVSQGKMALKEMHLEFEQNTFWSKPDSTQALAEQLEEREFAPAAAANIDCDSKKNPAIRPVVTRQPG